MEELDKLKMDWKKNEGNYPRFSDNDIYKMLHRKSSSIVKWILIISILEFVFLLILTILLSDSKSTNKIESYIPSYVDIGLSVVYYGIILYFIFQFYKNYRKITATDSTKNLMVSILHTRKTVSHYIFANISYIIVSSAIVIVLSFHNDPLWLDTLHKSESVGRAGLAYLLYFAGAIVFIGIFSLVFWFFYRLIYGLLLKRLHRNYEELKKIDF